MKFPVLQGLDLSRPCGSGSPALETDLASRALSYSIRSESKAFTRLRSRRNEVLADEALDEDLMCTPPLDIRTPAMTNLSKNKRQFSDLEPTGMGTGGEDVEMMSERRRSLFEPLSQLVARSPESLLPPPDFDSASYPKGWVIGKKRKLVNVDVVESMRRIAVQEMNRKDREIDGLNEQLEEDARTMEHLQLELQQERQRRFQAEREKVTLQAQADMLMTMLNEFEEDAAEMQQLDDCQVING